MKSEPRKTDRRRNWAVRWPCRVGKTRAILWYANKNNLQLIFVGPSIGKPGDPSSGTLASVYEEATNMGLRACFAVGTAAGCAPFGAMSKEGGTAAWRRAHRALCKNCPALKWFSQVPDDVGLRDLALPVGTFCPKAVSEARLLNPGPFQVVLTTMQTLRRVLRAHPHRMRRLAQQGVHIAVDEAHKDEVLYTENGPFILPTRPELEKLIDGLHTLPRRTRGVVAGVAPILLELYHQLEPFVERDQLRRSGVEGKIEQAVLRSNRISDWRRERKKLLHWLDLEEQSADGSYLRYLVELRQAINAVEFGTAHELFDETFMLEQIGLLRQVREDARTMEYDDMHDIMHEMFTAGNDEPRGISEWLAGACDPEEASKAMGELTQAEVYNAALWTLLEFALGAQRGALRVTWNPEGDTFRLRAAIQSVGPLVDGWRSARYQALIAMRDAGANIILMSGTMQPVELLEERMECTFDELPHPPNTGYPGLRLVVEEARRRKRQIVAGNGLLHQGMVNMIEGIGQSVGDSPRLVSASIAMRDAAMASLPDHESHHARGPNAQAVEWSYRPTAFIQPPLTPRDSLPALAGAGWRKRGAAKDSDEGRAEEMCAEIVQTSLRTARVERDGKPGIEAQTALLGGDLAIQWLIPRFDRWGVKVDVLRVPASREMDERGRAIGRGLCDGHVLYDLDVEVFQFLKQHGPATAADLERAKLATAKPLRRSLSRLLAAYKVEAAPKLAGVRGRRIRVKQGAVLCNYGWHDPIS